MIGVSNVAFGPDWAQSAKRLVDIPILGSRPIALGQAEFHGLFGPKEFLVENHQTGLEIGQEQRGDEQGAKDGFDAI